MAIVVIKAREFPLVDRLEFTVHLDTTKVDGQGAPLERWLMRRTWPRNKVPAQRAVFTAAIKAELTAAALAQIAILQEEDAGGTPLPMEGAVL